MSQTDLALRASVDPKTLRSLETGDRWPQDRTRARIEDALAWPARTLEEVRAGAEIPNGPPLVAPAAPNAWVGDTSVLANLALAAGAAEDSSSELLRFDRSSPIDEILVAIMEFSADVDYLADLATDVAERGVGDRATLVLLMDKEIERRRAYRRTRRALIAQAMKRVADPRVRGARLSADSPAVDFSKTGTEVLRLDGVPQELSFSKNDLALAVPMMSKEDLEALRADHPDAVVIRFLDESAVPVSEDVVREMQAEYTARLTPRDDVEGLDDFYDNADRSGS